MILNKRFTKLSEDLSIVYVQNNNYLDLNLKQAQKVIVYSDSTNSNNKAFYVTVLLEILNNPVNDGGRIEAKILNIQEGYFESLGPNEKCKYYGRGIYADHTDVWHIII